MKRVLLKLSGEALAGEKKTGFDEATVIEVAKQIRTIAEEGLEIGIVIGGGNFWRGRTSETIDRNKADQIGMLATVMNCIYVSDICRYLGLKTEIFTPFVCGAFKCTADGIYDSDPKTNPNAVKYDEISIEEVVAKKLAAMDLTASIMCMEQKMPMLVFALDEKDSIINAVHGKFVGTKVTV